MRLSEEMMNERRSSKVASLMALVIEPPREARRGLMVRRRDA
jgi:hypothetical protein